MRYLKQSTSVDGAIGPFLDETDGKTAETALTITQPDVRLKKNNANWGQKNAAQTLSHEENGWYEVTLDATDTNTLGVLMLAVHEAGALPVWVEFMVLPANVYDSLFATDLLQVDLTQWLGSTPAALSTNGFVQTMVMRWIADNGTGIPDALIGNKVPSRVTIMDTAVIGTNQIATAAITADKLAADVIGATQLAQSAVNKILDAFLLRRGTAQTGANGSITLDAGASATNDYYKHAIVAVVSGTGAGQARFIAGYAGSTKVASVDANWKTNPDSTSGFLIFAFHQPVAATPTAADIADAVWDEDVDTSHQTAGSAGKKLDDAGAAADPWSTALPGAYAQGSAGHILGHQRARAGTAQAGAAGTITLDAGASSSDDFYNNSIVQIVAGAGAGQSRILADYTGATKVAAVNGNWVTNPDSTSVFVVYPFGSIPGASAPTAGQVADAVWDEAIADHQAAGSTGKVLNTRVTGGSGALSRTIGVTVGGNPLEGASVWVATDAAGVNIVAGPLTTSSSGIVTVRWMPEPTTSGCRRTATTRSSGSQWW